MLDVTVGHDVDCTIVYLDQDGNPMNVPVVPDSPPTWTNAPSSSNVDSLNISQDGTECDVTAIAVGTDTLTLTVVVGGKSFTADLQLNIQPPPQVLTSVRIEAVVK